MKALAMKARVRSTTAKCLVKVFAAAKAPTTVRDPSTAMEAAAVPGIGRRYHSAYQEGCGDCRYENSGHEVTSRIRTYASPDAGQLVRSSRR
jgi:hypothetical protein